MSTYVAIAVDQEAPTMPPPRRDCSCCGRSISDAEWSRFPFRGLQDDGDGGWLALLNCECGSTLARETVGVVLR